jgi:hypothetical protein
MDTVFPTTATVIPPILPFLRNLFGWGCSHEDYTVPMQLPGESGVTVSCLKCATRLRYDWDRMGLACEQ